MIYKRFMGIKNRLFMNEFYAGFNFYLKKYFTCGVIFLYQREYKSITINVIWRITTQKDKLLKPFSLTMKWKEQAKKKRLLC